ncbi:hypothetical protein E4U22_007160 [Claviceps purpurea]|nr:hypothetical protein E4U12_002911 [Claviceps purpurea]KAG6151893.1 hypothetical protein E4U11_007679 [Claviceps purpurea]KAG6194068.1 hypothetical protein E4U10_003325 [Claviceps purpurea]KAG6220621.1 hypothetical protein E4U34_002723 [Claviceps purpurea]KAG6225153.1 hypothetical protein E4U26_003231 [Claviceps purpurea]
MFHPFSRLAPELRHHIWRLSLPDNIGPALHFYQRDGYWRARKIEEHESIYRPGEEQIEFRTELIDPEVQLCLPQFFVNHEAHRIAAAWLREEGREYILSLGTTQKLDRFVRPFNENRDILYIPYDKWHQFNTEPRDRAIGRGMQGVPAMDVVQKPITIALPHTVIWNVDLLRCFPEVKSLWFNDPVKLFVILGEQPEQIGSPAEHDSWYWEIEDTGIGALVWDMVKQDFVFEQGANAFDFKHRAISANVQNAARNGLLGGMIENGCESLEIRLAYAALRMQ